MPSSGAEELVMVSFHVQLQGTLMYIGDIAITIQSWKIACTVTVTRLSSWWQVLYLIWSLLRRILRSCRLTQLLWDIIPQQDHHHASMHVFGVVTFQGTSSTYSVFYCALLQVQSLSWGVRDMNGLHQGCRAPEKDNNINRRWEVYTRRGMIYML